MKPSSPKCKHPWNVLFPGVAVIKSKQSFGESEDILTFDFPGS